MDTLLLAAFCDFKDRRFPNWSPGLDVGFDAPLRVLEGRLMLRGDAVPDCGSEGLARKLLYVEANVVGFKGGLLLEEVAGFEGFCQSSPKRSSIFVITE